jgi:hypothetical protein
MIGQNPTTAAPQFVTHYCLYNAQVYRFQSVNKNKCKVKVNKLFILQLLMRLSTDYICSYKFTWFKHNYSLLLIIRTIKGEKNNPWVAAWQVPDLCQNGWSEIAAVYVAEEKEQI